MKKKLLRVAAWVLPVCLFCGHSYGTLRWRWRLGWFHTSHCPALGHDAYERGLL
jgi:hypothetical protein